MDTPARARSSTFSISAANLTKEYFDHNPVMVIAGAEPVLDQDLHNPKC